jgi:hypothetical protein
MPTPLRTSGFSCSWLNLLCSRTCAAEAWPAHRVASCRTAALGHISGAPLLLRSHSNGPQPACAWSVALHMHSCLWKRAESATGRTLSLASANTPVQFCSDLRVLHSAALFHLLPAVTPSGPAYHRRRSCAACRIRAALLLPQAPRALDRLVPLRSFSFRCRPR